MADKMTAEQRHRCMSRIRGKNTKPEMVVRRWLWAHGYRYQLHVSRLPGSPDIVMRKIRTVIFVNGCFWHGHNCPHGQGLIIDDSECCKIPRSNRHFWVEKIRTNMRRDAENVAGLKAAGWHVITVWECELRPKSRTLTLDTLSRQLAEIANPGAYIPGSYATPEESVHVAAEPQSPYTHADDLP